MKSNIRRKQAHITRKALVAGLMAGGYLFGSAAYAEQPGRGKTAPFEIGYLKFIIDHHYSALRITELTAGTDVTREAAINAAEGTAPTPDTAATPAKSSSDAIKSLARRNNRMQREEIMQAQHFLHEWYNIDYQPKLSRTGRAQIALLESSPAGPAFDQTFLEVFSRHHDMALVPSAQCMVSVELTHDALQRYCSGIVHAQTNDILEMRHMLCDQFAECDYQPLGGLTGRRTGREGAKAGNIEEFEQPVMQ
jgi:uncharacterized protein (DUF305 family)